MRIVKIIFLILFFGCSNKGGNVVDPVVNNKISAIKCTDPKDLSTPFHGKGILNGNEYFLICDGDELSHINGSDELLSKNYVIGKDIDLSEYYTGDYLNNPEKTFMIGTYPDHPFTGTFSGDGYSIINFRLKNPIDEYCGLFGYAKNATIQYLEVADVRIDAGLSKCGAIIGRSEGVYLNKVYNYIYQTDLLSENQWNYISGSNIAGFIFESYSTTVRESYSLITLIAEDSNNYSQMAGLIGYMRNNSFIINSFFDGIGIGTTNSAKAGITFEDPIVVDFLGNPMENPQISLLQNVGYSINKGINMGCLGSINCGISSGVFGVDSSNNYFFIRNNNPLASFSINSWMFDPAKYPKLQ